ncbi:hypothetical protein EG349_06635 [Chryseobacterium shandongense]|uniref:Uncharacterized protein n=1 Tax=Chryseobacterium shandongense TaxID=1493872 RepID=A0AAD0Y9L0_9FLAO|nr:hypothetical protein [Chryseobacterium shandongense]AZA86486.1 hypothetical protein EG349_06635 [Chryseobacterium shandongense]AZA94894.1 hypothetical protein EG353_04645 [Chryseobacterium shandongense]
METTAAFSENLLSKQLKDYFSNKFTTGREGIQTPSDEKFWEEYVGDSNNSIPFHILRELYPQLNFSIEEGIEKSQSYRDAVRKGSFILSDKALRLHRESEITLKLHQNIAYEIPVLTVPDETDFETLIQCLIHKNNPVKVPISMGASLISGINNWKKINNLKQKWSESNSSVSWNEEFSKNIIPNTYLYKDRIILLSMKPYSNVNAEKLNISSDEWKKMSLKIRLEHECVHLYTLQKFGSASNNLHDELIADYIGILAAAGTYQKDWMLTFMGLEEYPKYRPGARLENYLAGMKLSATEFAQVIKIIKNAIENIAAFSNQLKKMETDHDKKSRIEALCLVDLLEISSSQGTQLLLDQYDKASAR